MSFIPKFGKYEKTKYLLYVSPQKFEKVIEDNSFQIEEFVLGYMQEFKGIRDFEFVQALLKICVDHKPSLLNRIEFYNNLPTSLLMENIKIIEDQHLYHALALINSLSNRPDVALNLWKE